MASDHPVVRFGRRVGKLHDDIAGGERVDAFQISGNFGICCKRQVRQERAAS